MILERTAEEAILPQTHEELVTTASPARHGCAWNEGGAVGKGLLLWMVGIPLPLILILWLLGLFH